MKLHEVFFRLMIGTSLLFAGADLALPATTRTVTNLNDSGAGSLRQAIADSAAGDTINFSVTGTITLTSASLSVNHNLTIHGPGADNLNITRQSTSAFRIFYFDNGTWTLSDVTISNGSDSVTSGGIYNFNGNLTLNNCIVSGNSGGQRAGGIGNDATTTMNNCTLINNHSGAPGGVGGGGGIFNGGTGTLTMHNCTLSNNSSDTGGGGIVSQGTLTVTTSTFNDNTGPGAGAIYMVMAPGQNSTIQNCTFSHNTGVGTIRHAGDATLTVQSCTFTGNDVGAAGSIYVYTGAAVLRIGNTILDDVPSLFLRRGAIISLGYNLSRDDGGGFLTATGDQTQTDPELDPYGLQYNGGYTDTVALIYGSPAIDAGKSFGLTTDQRGQIRPYDNPNFANVSGSDGSDIGAYEAPSDPLGRTTGFIVTTTADHDDGMCGAADCTLREAIARADSLSTNLPRPISFGFGVTGTIFLNTNPIELTITTSMTISGPGARVLAVSGNHADRVFTVTGGTSTISGLTIRDGNYFTNQEQGESRQGGAVFNQANLTLNDCAFVNNTINGASNINNGGNGGTGQGGAVYNHSHLTLNGCTFTGNRAIGAAGNTFSSGTLFGPGGNGGAGQGGALFNDGAGTLSVTNCTFNANTATGGNGGSGNSQSFFAGGGNANGGAVYNLASMTITSATISGNTGTGGPGAGSGMFHGLHGTGNGGLSDASGSNGHVANTIVAGNSGNTAPDAEGTFTSSGYNLIGIGDQSSGFTMTGDQTGTTAAPINAQLGSLQNNGGPTDTMTPLGNSPAIDQGKSFGLTTDQRGQVRPYDEPSIPSASGGDGSDIGAVETQAQVGPTFTVTTAADHDDGTCSFSDCTLREAVNAANATSGPNTITFAATVTGSITLSLGTLNVTDSTTIIGPGARVLSVNGNATYRIFYFSTGTSTISGLTISNGAIVGPPAGAVTGAGAIFNQGTLTVNDCTLSSNQALGSNNTSLGGDGGTVEGGAIANSGTLTLNRCTFSGNSAAGGRGGDNFMTFGHAGHGGAGEGAAVFNYGTGTLSINNCTFSGNGAAGGAGGNGSFGGGGGNGSGAAVFNLGTLTVTGATVSGNTGSGGAGGSSSSGPPGTPGLGIGGLAAGAGSNTVGDTISAGNNGGAKDVNGTFSSNGYNLIGSGDHSTGFTNGSNHDQVGTDAASVNAQLGALQNNGGATNTMALLSNSPAINKGDPNAPSQDQRYYLRSGVPDVGAFEYQGMLAPVSAVSQKTHGGAGAFNLTLPLTGSVGIECRSGGSTNDHLLILTFATPVMVNGAPQAHVTTGTGQVGSAGSSNGGVASVNGGVVTVPLTNVSNAQQIAVTLSSVSDGTNTNNVVIPMSVLLGDTTANGTVNSSDIAQTQSQSGQPVNSSNFREDVTVNGSINSSDIALVQSKSGTALPVGVGQSPDPTTTAPKHRGSPEKSF